MATETDIWKIVSESSQFQADLDAQRKKLDLRTAALAQFRKVGPPTLAEYEAAEKKAAKEVEKATLAAVAAYERRAAGPSAHTLAVLANTEALVGNRATINMAREATGAFASALSLVSPEAAAAAQGLQKAEAGAAGLAGAGQLAGVSVGALTTGLGAAAVAVVPAYLAWRQSAADLEEMDRWVKITAGDLETLRQGAETIVDAQAELDRRFQKLRGTMTEQEAATYAEAEAQDVYQEELDGTSSALDHATQRLDEMRRRLSDKTVWESLGDMFNPLRWGSKEALAAIQQQEAEVGRLKEDVADLHEEEKKYAGRVAEVTLAEERRTSGVKAGAAATKDATKAERDLAEQRAASQAAASAYASAMVVFTGAEDDYEASLSKTDAALVKRDQTLAKLADSYQRAVESASALGDMEGLAAADAAYQRARVAAEAQANAEIEALHESLYGGLLKTAQDEAKKEADARKIVQDALLGQTDAALSAIESAAGAESAAGKAAAITQIILGEIALLSKAAAYGPAAPAYIALGQIPLALAAAKLAGLGKADATVTDSPRVMQAGPNGANIRVAPGDQVAAARTRRDLQAQVGGGGGGSAQVTVALQVAGRTTQRITATAKQTTRRTGRHTPAGTKGRR